MERLLQALPVRMWPVGVRYLATLAIMVVAMTMQLGLNYHAGFDTLFLLLPAVFLTGLLFDRGSGLLAAFCAILVCAFWIVPQTFAEHLLPTTLFSVTAVGAAVAAETLRREVITVAAAERAKSALLRELAHRTKNNLAVLSALVRLQAKADPGIAAALETTARRIHILAEVYDHLTLREDAKYVSMRDYLTDICNKITSALGESPVAIAVEADELLLSSEQAVPLAIIANELVTNCLKYAFPDNRAGLIAVAFRAGERLELTVTDNGIGLNGAPRPSGLGSRIVAMLAQQLNGSLSYQQLAPGCRVVFSAPLPRSGVAQPLGRVVPAPAVA